MEIPKAYIGSRSWNDISLGILGLSGRDLAHEVGYWMHRRIGIYIMIARWMKGKGTKNCFTLRSPPHFPNP